MHHMYEKNQAQQHKLLFTPSHTRAAVIGLSLIAALGLAACNDKKDDPQKAQAAAQGRARGHREVLAGDGRASTAGAGAGLHFDAGREGDSGPESEQAARRAVAGLSPGRAHLRHPLRECPVRRRSRRRAHRE